MKHGMTIDQFDIDGDLTYARREIDAIEDFQDEVQMGDVVWDIGANIGVYSLVASHEGATTFAFEPLLENVIKLMENVSSNDLVVHPIPVALSNKTGQSEFGLDDETNDEPGASLNKLGEGKRVVPTLRGDEFGVYPDVIKLDVEGDELNVLRGMQEAFASARAVYVEIHHEADHRSIRCDPADVLEFIEAAGTVRVVDERTNEVIVKVQ